MLSRLDWSLYFFDLRITRTPEVLDKLSAFLSRIRHRRRSTSSHRGREVPPLPIQLVVKTHAA
jgi:hypothetical protein